jgi:hypothetical protein
MYLVVRELLMVYDRHAACVGVTILDTYCRSELIPYVLKVARHSVLLPQMNLQKLR